MTEELITEANIFSGLVAFPNALGETKLETAEMENEAIFMGVISACGNKLFLFVCLKNKNLVSCTFVVVV